MTKVMIIDDDKNIVYALTSRLKTAGYQVVSAYDPVSGMSTLTQEKPDLLLLDINMPGGGGLLMIERITKHPKINYLPIIVITASREPDMLQKCKNLGIEHFFEKPFDTQEILETIKKVAA